MRAVLESTTLCKRVVLVGATPAVFTAVSSIGLGIFADVITDARDTVKEIRIYGITQEHMSVGVEIQLLGTYAKIEHLPESYKAIREAL